MSADLSSLDNPGAVVLTVLAIIVILLGLRMASGVVAIAADALAAMAKAASAVLTSVATMLVFALVAFLAMQYVSRSGG